MTEQEADIQVPPLECDFNAVGWSGEPDDRCVYVLHQTTLLALAPTEGTRAFLFMYEDTKETEVFGCEATLEWVKLATEGWRARPDESAWYRRPRTR